MKIKILFILKIKIYFLDLIKRGLSLDEFGLKKKIKSYPL